MFIPSPSILVFLNWGLKDYSQVSSCAIAKKLSSVLVMSTALDYDEPSP